MGSPIVFYFIPYSRFALLAIKDELFDAISAKDKSYGKNQNFLYQLFYDICTSYPDVYSDNQKSILTQINQEWLVAISERIWQLTASIDNENADNYWESKVQTFIKQYWPYEHKNKLVAGFTKKYNLDRLVLL